LNEISDKLEFESNHRKVFVPQTSDIAAEFAENEKNKLADILLLNISTVIKSI